MKLIITLFATFTAFISFQYKCDAQRFFFEEGEVEAVALASDEFISSKGNLTNKKFTVENRIISEDLVEKSYFDKKNRLVTKRYYDHYGELYYDDYGIAIYEYSYDEKGNRTEVKYYNENKEPFQINFVGPASIKYNYDEQNRITKVSYYNAYNELSASMGNAVIEFSYNENGQIAEERRFDSDLEPIDFFAPIISYKYDEDGRVIEKSHYDIHRKLVSRMLDDEDDPIAIIRFSYLGGEIQPTFFNRMEEEIEIKL